jgi:iron complex outermembrane receptor protein
MHTFPARLVRRVALFLAAAAVGPAATQAQQPTGTVRGIVRDSATGEVASFARVRVIEAHREVTTHVDGRFAIPGIPVGPVTVAVQRIGFASRTVRAVVTAGGIAELEVALVPSAAALAATVVTGTVAERASDDALSSTSILGGAALDRKLDATVSATLAGTPGFAVTSMGPATARPVLRGLGGDRVLVLEDGLRPGDLSANSPDHATAIEPAAAKQIEVVRGPMSLLYGSSALGGVINVVQDVVPTSLPDDTHGTVTVGGASAQPGAHLAAVVSTRRGDIAWRAEGSARQAGDLATPTGTMPNTQLGTYAGSLGASKVGPDGYAGVAVRGYYSAYGLPGGFVGAHPNGVDIAMRRATVRGDAERHVAWGPFSQLRTNAQYTFYSHDEVSRTGSISVSFLQHLAAFEAVTRHQAWGWAASGAVGMRAQFRQVDVGGANRAADTRDVSLAGFAVQEYGTGSLRAQAGLRYDVAVYQPIDPSRTVEVGGALVPVRDRTFGALSGSVGAQWEALDGVRIGAGVARAFRTPDFNELYSDGPHLAAYSYDVGNPAIRHETGVGAEAWVRVNRGAVRAEASVYRNELTDYIYLVNTGEIGRQGFVPKFQFRNADALFVGAEGSLSWEFARGWVAEGTVTAVRATRTDLTARDSVPRVETVTDTFPAAPASRYLPWIPPVQGTVGLRWESRRFFAGGTARLLAQQARTGDYERPTDGATIIGLQAGARLLVGARFHTITLRLDNAGNVLYRDHLSRTKVILPEMGRNLSVLYRIAF